MFSLSANTAAQLAKTSAPQVSMKCGYMLASPPTDFPAYSSDSRRLFVMVSGDVPSQRNILSILRLVLAL